MTFGPISETDSARCCAHIPLQHSFLVLFVEKMKIKIITNVHQKLILDGRMNNFYHNKDVVIIIKVKLIK